MEQPFRFPQLTNLHFQSQEPEEKIFLLLRPHAIVNLSWAVPAALGGLLPLFLPVFLGWVEPQLVGVYAFPLAFIAAYWWYLLLFAWSLERLLSWYLNVTIITDRRLVDIDFWGYGARNVSETPLGKIQDVTYRISGVSASMLNYGNIIIQTAAELPEFECFQVPDPARVHDVLTDLVGGNHGQP